jgi:DNA-binding MurR/RpiR family transcriptional regulator
MKQMQHINWLKGGGYILEKQELLEKIRQQYPKLSKSQKKIAKSILESWESVAFTSPEEFGNRLGVSETTVIRFAKRLGYENYSDLRNHIRELIKVKLTPARKMSTTVKKINEAGNPLEKLYDEVHILKEGISNISIEDFELVIRLIKEAKRVFIIGFGVSAALCHFLNFRFTRMQIDTRILTHGGKTFYDNLLLLNENDLVIGIGFFRCDPAIIKAFQYAKDQGVKRIAITHSPFSELAKLSDAILVANRGPKEEIKSLVVPMAILNFLTVLLVQKNEGKETALLKLENIYSDFYDN